MSEKNKAFVRNSTNVSEYKIEQKVNPRRNLLGSRSSVPIRSRPNTTGYAMPINAKHGSAANLEGASTDDGFTTAHNRKTSVTGITNSHTKF